MLYVRITSTGPELYSLGDLSRDNPLTSFPVDPTEEVLAEYGVYPLLRDPVPAHDPLTQVGELLTPVLENGQWVQHWTVVSLPLEVQMTNLRDARSEAFRMEADPLLAKWLAGEATKEEWEEKREEIRARYPYPEA